MTKRQFLKLSAYSAVLASMPSMLFANNKQDFNLYAAPAIITSLAAISQQNGKIKDNYNFNIKTWKNPDELRAGLANKSIQITMAPSNVGVLLSNKGLDMKLVNILTDGLLSIVSRDKNISQLQDLKGKKLICIFKGDMPDLILQSLLRANNLQLDITYSSSPSEALNLFLAKKFDAALLTEPLSTIAVFKSSMPFSGGEVFRNFNLNVEFKKAFNIDSIPQAGIICTSDFYNSNKDLIELLNSDLTAALDFVKKDIDKSAKLTSQYMEVPAKAIKKAFPYSNLVVKKARDNKDEIMKFYQVLFDIDPKILGGKMPNDDFFV